MNIYRLLKIAQKDGRLAIRDQNPATKIEIITDLLALKKLSIKTNLQKLRKDIERISNIRNEIAHGIWVEGKENVYLRITKGNWQPEKNMKGKVKRTMYPEAKKFNINEAKALTAEIDAITTRVITLGQEISSALHSSN